MNIFFLKKQKPPMITVILNDNKWDKSNVIFKNELVLKYNKKKPKPAIKFIDYGLCVLSKSLFDKYEVIMLFDLTDFYHFLSIQNQLVGFEVNERFYEIGSHQGIKETKLYLSAK